MRQKVDAQILFPNLKIPKFRKWVSYNPTPPYISGSDLSLIPKFFGFIIIIVNSSADGV